MNSKEIRAKLLKRRKVLGTICIIVLSPVLIPLLLVNKLGELSEKIANIIQAPCMIIINKHLRQYRKKLDKQMTQKENK